MAEEIGIPNLSQFSKLFHKQTGMSPTLYLQKQHI
ncbi:MAG TPA: helix-turn-helix domain-containing protein [Candidatus Bacteroides merdavium]|uniref:Helix-turn-helix domain-containing protein n=1 Tax=Candidatus Bacteroides merdavium TaxID=2838472 RepID=A0A9D2GZL1_9BACE|nr:helix-turn-helix domain-containing protein [Candidatus Bacteroides merdavium]